MFIIGEKIDMSQVWDEKGNVYPVTRVKCAPLKVIKIKEAAKDGYQAVVVGNDENIKEYRGKNLDQFKQDQEVSVNLFKQNDKVKVTAKSKGKGFQGVVKRHGFKGGIATHGHRHDLRQTGAIGSAFPQHVMKGKKMAGRMGFKQVSIKNLRIMQVREKEQELLISGSIPGSRGRKVYIEKINS
ncbi:MAG: 50S ribosomal protein L3 [Candidatus Moranbacteria bacterium]|nr:50S ribosomal protein L3 [Candidatus Moranbacteria bacterium]